MAFSLKNTIFSLFGYNDKVVDSYKNVSGKGIYERYLEALGEEYDTYTLTAIDNLLENTIIPNKMLLKFLPYQEDNLGIPYFTSDEFIRRKILKYIFKVNQCKGTKVSYEMLFRLFGFTVDFYLVSPGPLSKFNYYSVDSLSNLGTATIFDGTSNIVLNAGDKFYVTNDFSTLVSFTGDAKLKRETIIDFFKVNFTFDDGNLPGGGEMADNPTFDQEGRTFDSKCNGCGKYVVRLYHPDPITIDLHNTIFRIIEYCEPINAKLMIVFYNDILLMADDSISVWIDENGDFNYDNTAVPEISLTLVEGDLFINGVSINQYYINSQGDLIFNP